nr:hypothetical protein StreXyl84_79430 [Streptomyces sp. Xyl84]
MPAVVRLPAGKALTVRAAADVFLDSLDNPNTLRSYSTGIGKTAERLGEIGVPVRTLSPAANGDDQSADLEGRGSSAVLVDSASARRPPFSSGR